MATRSDILTTATSQIGTVETGRNVVPYWPALGLPQGNTNGWAWCAAFITWVYLQCGVDLRKELNWPYYCPYIVRWAKESGRWKTSDPRPGDLVLYDFTGSGVAAHVGIHEATTLLGTFQAVEGNTSPGNTGSQANGGGVWRRYRSRGVILGWVDMSSLLEVAPPVVHRDLLAVDGSLGPKTLRALQTRLGVPVTGRISRRSPSLTVRAYQRLLISRGHTIAADGFGLRPNTGVRKVGPTWTIRAMQMDLGTTVDGYLSPEDSRAVRALQRRLNEGRL